MKDWEAERVYGDESGESMKPMKEVQLIGLGESQLEWLVHCW